MTRVAGLTGSEPAAVAVSTAAFVAYHASGRRRARLAQLSVVGAAFGVAFVLTGSLLAAIIVHVAYDALSLSFTDSEDLDRANA